MHFRSKVGVFLTGRDKLTDRIVDKKLRNFRQFSLRLALQPLVQFTPRHLENNFHKRRVYTVSVLLSGSNTEATGQKIDTRKLRVATARFKLDFGRFLESGLPSGEERGLLSRTAACNRA